MEAKKNEVCCHKCGWVGKECDIEHNHDRGETEICPRCKAENRIFSTDIYQKSNGTEQQATPNIDTKTLLIDLNNTLHNVKSFLEALQSNKLDNATVKLWADIKECEIVKAIKDLQNKLNEKGI